MENKSFTRTIRVKQKPAEVFDAINNVRGWWSEDIEGDTDKPGAVFNYHYKDVHLTRMRIIEFIPAKKVVWKVLDNYFNFIKDNSEWKNTTVHFDISEKDNQTELTFTHEGLTPADECFNVCNDAWNNYITNSLRDLITTGSGKPNKKDTSDDFNKTMVEKWNLQKQ